MGKLVKGSPASIGLAFASASKELKKATGYTFKEAQKIQDEFQRQQVLDRWKQIILNRQGLVWENEKVYKEQPDYPNGENIALSNLEILFNYVRYLHSNYGVEDEIIFTSKDEYEKTYAFSIEEIASETGVEFYLNEIQKRLDDIHNLVTEIQAIVYADDIGKLREFCQVLLDYLTKV